MEPETIEIPALGRPLQPGMLYDCRSDTFIPAIKLWDDDAIKRDMSVDPQPNTNLQFTASDSFSEKSKLIDVSASVKASFLSGLVEVGGSARYMKDTKSSEHQCRFTMQFKQTTVFKQLAMKQLGNVTYPEVFDQQTATHVVIAAMYGADAYMLFDQIASDENQKQTIEASMEVMVKKLPSIDVSASGKVELTDEEKKKVQNFNCTFYGDVILKQNPSNYEEAVLVYKELPSLLGDDGSKAVPTRVWLYPLHKLNPKAAQLVKQIGLKLVSRLETAVSQLHDANMRANDIKRRCQVVKATDIADKLDTFKNKMAIYIQTFHQNLSDVLPAVRKGSAEEQKLVDILDFHDKSSFTYDLMNKWLGEKESEIGVVENYISSLKDIKIVPPGPELNTILFDPKNETVYVFTFTSLKYEEPYLSNLGECLASDKFKKMNNTAVADELRFRDEDQPWYSDADISDRMRNVLEQFQAYLCDPVYKCISYISDLKFCGASIYMYNRAILIQKL